VSLYSKVFPLLSVPGYPPVLLFNQRKRNRIPLKSAPCGNEFFSQSEYLASSSSSAPHSSSGKIKPLPYFMLSLTRNPSNTHPMRSLLKTSSLTVGISCDRCSVYIDFSAVFQQEALPVKPAVENSLRILTTVIEGMRHWSQFKDKVSYLFEIFATLDSAVTLGSYGAKNFLLRDGKEVVQCVFYENRVLPRLIRGQVHRCVGNYDRGRDILVCVSVRAGLSSEQRNAQEAIRASDAEMRALVKTLSEV
uniref:Spermatogenesis associated 22 n=1 Tax=Kryptolebias marmoratus TaxID=37003 RepID=A0A3Q3FTE2_KRYMA